MAMTESSRMDRVNEEFREILAAEVARLKDPRVGFVTITAVRVTPDLRKARVYFTVLGEDADRRATRAALRSARSHLRSELGRQIHMKFTPEIEFMPDDDAERADRIEQILATLHDRERGMAREEARDGDD